MDILIYDPETEQVRTPLSDTSLQKLAGEVNIRTLLRQGWNCVGIQMVVERCL